MEAVWKDYGSSPTRGPLNNRIISDTMLLLLMATARIVSVNIYRV